MAARENQGLQIALIIFVVLTIALSATTFVFLRNYQDQVVRTDDAKKAAADVRSQMTELQGERDQFVQYLGFPSNERKAAVDEAWAKDMAEAQQFGIANLPDDQKNYRTYVASLQDVIRTLQKSLNKKEADLRDATEAFNAKTAEYESVKQQLAKDKAKTVSDYEEERKRIADELAKLTASKNDLMKQKEEKDNAYSQLQTELQAKITGLEGELAKALEELKRRSEELQGVRGEQVVSASPDGKIAWVNARDNAAYINLGSDDRLRKRLTFSVYDPTVTDVSKGRPKGSIEVVNVTERHMAECRILESSTSNPILPGDFIYTPIWSVGQQDRMALVGTLDIDGDGIEDRQRVHDLIAAQGGIIDAEVDAEGNLQGEVTLNTRYVIVGEIDAENRAASESNFKILEAAKRYSVETIPLGKFVEMTGYAPKAAEGKLAPGAGVPIPNPGQPPSGFRPRNPPTRTNAHGAF